MGSVRKASWAVAASVATIEALKDQAGLCRWNYALRCVQLHAKSRAKSLQSQINIGSAADRVRFLSSAAPLVNGPSINFDELMMMKRRRRRAEKAQNAYHLVCWGPN